MSLDLIAAYGWDAAWAGLFSQHARPGQVPGRVIEQQRGLWSCMTPDGERAAVLPGGSRGAAQPATGDWVTLEPAADRLVIQAILPRRSRISRQAAGLATAEQVLAANMDTLFLCMALGRDFNLRRLERVLTVAWSSGAEPVIVLTKADLTATGEADASLAAVAAAAPSVALCLTSGTTGAGVAALVPWLGPARTVALIGASGAGKSTLVNALAGSALAATGAVDADGKGRHTTTSRSLLRLPGGALVLDNPGIRELQLWDGESGLDRTFPEIQALAAACRFRDCRHEREPGCAVRAAIGAGTLDPARLGNRAKLARELAFAERKHDKAAQAAERDHWRRIHKDNRAREAHRARLHGPERD